MDVLLVGLFIFVISLAMGFSGLRFMLTAKSTTGEIIRINSRTDDNKIYVSAPVVRYEDGNGTSYVHESSLYNSSSNRLKVGDQIPIYYRPAEPHFAYTGTKLSFFSIEITTLVLGIIVLLFGTYDMMR